MNHDWETIADSIRAEIADNGRLIQLFDEQQRAIIRGDAGDVLELSNAIQAQVGALASSRRDRQAAVGAFALAHGEAPGANLRSLLPHCPPEARPLLEELAANLNRLIHRVRRGSRQNHKLLQYTVEMHQEILRRLRPEAFTKTYASDGRVSVAALQSVPTIQSAG